LIKDIRGALSGERACLPFDRKPFVMAKDILAVNEASISSLPWLPIKSLYNKIQEKYEQIGTI
jgi:uncharacterized cysteine cluster protein YcgN (CxxCxxCC family)